MQFSAFVAAVRPVEHRSHGTSLICNTFPYRLIFWLPRACYWYMATRSEKIRDAYARAYAKRAPAAIKAVARRIRVDSAIAGDAVHAVLLRMLERHLSPPKMALLVRKAIDNITNGWKSGDARHVVYYDPDDPAVGGSGRKGHTISDEEMGRGLNAFSLNYWDTDYDGPLDPDKTPRK